MRSSMRAEPIYPTLADTIGRTPLIRLQRLPGDTTNVVLGKLEGNNPAGSVKDRPALSMIDEAERRGDIKPGDTLLEATSGNTGIALAMVAAIRGYKLVLVMPDNQSQERVRTMRAYGAELVLTPKAGGMENARDVAEQMRADGRGVILDQFANPDNPLAHYRGTGPEIWQDTGGRITHFVSAMGTTANAPGGALVWWIVDFAASFAVLSLAFSLVFRYTPSVRLGWRDVLVGGALTSFLFVTGKSILSYYLARGSTASAYGAAGSLVILLIWIYYTAQIVFFGAEFTQVLVKSRDPQVAADDAKAEEPGSSRAV